MIDQGGHLVGRYLAPGDVLNDDLGGEGQSGVAGSAMVGLLDSLKDSRVGR